MSNSICMKWSREQNGGDNETCIELRGKVYILEDDTKLRGYNLACP